MAGDGGGRKREGPLGRGPVTDVAARIHELLFRFGEADAILSRTLDDSLSRDALGLTEDE